LVAEALKRIGGQEAEQALEMVKLNNTLPDESAEKAHSGQEEVRGMIKRILILVDKRLPSNEHFFVQEILSTMRVNEKSYTEQISKDTVIKVYEVGNIDFDSETSVLGVLLFAYREAFNLSLNEEIPVGRLTLAPFKSLIGINGNVIAEFQTEIMNF